MGDHIQGMISRLTRVNSPKNAAPACILIGMATREARVRGRKRRLGTAEDAGRLCGVTPETYRYYVHRLGAPRHVSRRDETGEMEFDLDAVEAWHASRPGSGRHRATINENLRRTDLRHVLLSAAAAGTLVLVEGRVHLNGVEPARRVRQAVTELRVAGLLRATPTVNGEIRLTAVGERRLAEWQAGS